MSNPCGISTKDILKNIRDVVENNKSTATKKDVIDKLIVDAGMTTSEANKIANLYYQGYKDLLAKGAKTELSNMDRALQKNAQKYLSLEANAPLLTEADINYIQGQYERAKNYRDAGANDKASTIESNVSTFLLSKQPDQASSKLFENFLYTKPLLSVRFFQASGWSNLIANVNRVAATAFTTKGGVDLRPLKSMFGTEYGLLKAQSVMQGGISAMDINTVENNDINNARPEKIGGLGNNKVTKAANWLMSGAVNIGKKVIDVPDTFGIITGSDLHYRTIITNNKFDELRSQGVTKEAARVQARQYADDQMKLMDTQDAQKIADDVFAQDGVTVDDKFRKTNEYKVAVAEISRRNRDDETVQKAFLRSSEDYFKTRMTSKSEFGKYTDGIFGRLAQLAGAVKTIVTKDAEARAQKGDIKRAKIEKALGLGIFGFLNGASAFAERSLEAVPIYGLSKIALMQLDKKGKNQEIATAIGQKQKDILVNMSVAAVMYALLRSIKAIAEENCDKLKVPANSIYGKYRTTICGKQAMPFVIPAQYEGVFGFYNWVLDTNMADKKDNFIQDAIGAVAMLLSNVRMGNDTPSGKFVSAITEAQIQASRGNDVAATEYYNRAANEGMGVVVNYANSFLPIPTRPFQELGGYITSTQKQTRPVFDIKHPDSMLYTMKNAAALQVGNLINLNGYVQFFGDKNKPLIDWQGRTVMNLRAGYWAGEGIQYNKYDQLFADAQVPLPYLSPYQEVQVASAKGNTYSSPLSTKKVQEVTTTKRYLNEDEFFEVQKNVSEFNKKFFEKNYDTYAKMDKEKLSSELDKYSKRIKTIAFKGLEKGVKPENLLPYLNKNVISRRKTKSNKSVIAEEE